LGHADRKAMGGGPLDVDYTSRRYIALKKKGGGGNLAKTKACDLKVKAFINMKKKEKSI